MIVNTLKEYEKERAKGIVEIQTQSAFDHSND